MLKTTLLFFATALCEIIGCYLPWLWLKRGATPWLLMPTALALALFVWLLTLHPEASGAGALVALCGMLIIVAGWGRA
ncbi:MAG: YnfA family protein [Klebsiella michiganensis]|nr:YnfA family protein [Klebsiella michiganensis]